MTSLIRVVVGSENPVKIAAVRAVVLRVWPACVVVGHAVASGVPAQPFGDAETQQGALTRAREALARVPDADLGIGLEGGVVEEPDGRMRSCAWAAAIDHSGQQAVGGSLAMPLPERVARRIRAGEELGYAMDAIAQTVGTKHGRGAVGILTGGLLDRQGAYEPLVMYALAPWIAPQFYAER